jgi:hypothetical protein
MSSRTKPKCCFTIGEHAVCCLDKLARKATVEANGKPVSKSHIVEKLIIKEYEENNAKK